MGLTPDGPPLLPELFARAAQQWPDAVAVDVPPGAGHRRRTLTYRELDRKSDSAARLLRRALRNPGIVAILLPRTTEYLYSTQLAVLKSGSAYLCVDPAFPDEQIAHILRDAAPGVLVTDAEGQARALRAGFGGAVIRVDTRFDTASWPIEAPRIPHGLAYVIYTSGTTGRPKGVLIGHEGIANLVCSDLAEFGLGPGDRVAQGSSPAYDSSVEETWLALASGGTVVVMDDRAARLGPDLVPWLRKERVTVLCPPPTLLRATACADPEEELPNLRLLYVGGEALPDDVAERWAPGRRMVNGYGPTECTVTCLRADVEPGRPIAIGRPVPGMGAFVLDENLDPVPEGSPGELCMAGAGLAYGYHGKPELTAEKFPEHPRLGRLYRTGDLVHAEPDGTLYYHGRIDSQVKLRGYRIELEAIEAYLSRVDGVREAACRVQGDGASQVLAAHLVPVDASRPPDMEALKDYLRKVLPTYMVPSLFGLIGDLPRSAGGKLRRDDLPVLASSGRHRAPEEATSGNPAEEVILQAMREVFEKPSVAPGDDFFDDLGGSSLQAAMLVSRLRRNPLTAAIAVRDVYETRTVSELAQRVPSGDAVVEAPALVPEPPPGKPVLVTCVQAGWLLMELMIAAPIGFLVLFELLPWLAGKVGLLTLILAGPPVLVLFGLLWTPVAAFLAVTAKRLLIGTYQPLRVPVWSGLYARMWIVRHLLRFVPWATIAGTEFHSAVLRRLGARIGRRVHIHRGVNLTQGGWDLLEIGDDVTLGQDASIGLVRLTEGHVVVGPVRIGSGSTVDIRAGLAPDSSMGRGAWLAPLAALAPGDTVPDGQRWDGVPARPAGTVSPPPVPEIRGSVLSPLVHGLAMIFARSVMNWVLALPAIAASLGIYFSYNLSYDSLLYSVENPLTHERFLGVVGLSACISLLVTVAFEAVVARALGRVEPGVISRWSPAYIRVWLKSGLVDSASRWLSGGLYWPWWLRRAGMRLGRGCEISTIIDVVPELVDIGEDTFFADGIYLGGPRIQQGTVTCAPVMLSHDTFLGNHAVIPAGQRFPDNILVGVCTVADERVIRPGSSWFGHPLFELPRREVVAADRRLTHDPSLARRVTRLFWEWLRFALPLVPLAVFGLWIWAIYTVGTRLAWVPFLLAGVPLVTLVVAAVPCLVVLVLKWFLLGKVRAGTHPLWSCWCSRWDFLYVAWGVIAGGVLSSLEGTLLLPMYLRRMGMKIGRRVVLSEGFAQVVDPDMLEIADGATVSAHYQAHTFEDRVLKIGPVRVGPGSTLGEGTVPLYGAVVGASTYVAPHSVVMKGERLRSGLRYEGVPTRVVASAASAPVGSELPTASFGRFPSLEDTVVSPAAVRKAG